VSYNTLLLFIGFFFSCLFSFAQGVFEKGYFIDRSSQKTECYLVEEEWHSGGSLTYRNNYNETSQSKPLAEIAEISVTNAFKIIHLKIPVDISGDTPTLFSYTREPEWSEQDVFLWTLVEGAFNLYVYEGDGLTRYFYSTRDTPIAQLIFKKYKTAAGVEVNDLYKLTLFQNVNCTSNMSNYFNELNFTEEDLVKHFLVENKCAGSNPIRYSKAKVNNLIQTLANVNPSNEIEPVEPIKETAPSEKKSKSNNVIRYFGLEINQLLRQIIDLNSSNNAVAGPYQIQYSSNSRKTGRGVSYGLAYGRNKFTDDSNNTIRETINRSVSFRIGYERKHTWGKRWIALHGYDLTLGGTKLNTKNSQNGPLIEIEDKSNFWGFGPRVGLLFNLSQRVFIGTEASYYLKFTKGSQTISTGQPNSSQKSTDLSLTLPVTLFLSVKLNE
jgi:hypothetical protein